MRAEGIYSGGGDPVVIVPRLIIPQGVTAEEVTLMGLF